MEREHDGARRGPAAPLPRRRASGGRRLSEGSESHARFPALSRGGASPMQNDREPAQERTRMAQPERFEILILGSGKGGKLLAWEMARSAASAAGSRSLSVGISS